MVEGRNDATSCEGTCEVVERYVGHSLGYLFKTRVPFELVKKNGCPSPQLLKLMREILRDVSNLHDRGEAHGHLCRENILICWESRKTELQKGLHYYAVLGHCLKSSKTGCDVSVWQAPEQRKKNPGCLTFSADIYSLGEIFHYCITGMPSKSTGWETVGKKRDLPLVDCPAAKDLILWSLEENPKLRPEAKELQYHPLFWTPVGRLSFLHDIMNRPSYFDYSKLWKELQNLSVDEVTGGEWNENIQDGNVLGYIYEQVEKSEQKQNLGPKQNKEEACNYKFNSVLDLVRLIRNMKEHYRDLPDVVKQYVGEPPEDFDRFVTRQFPNLVIEVYKVVRKCCKEDRHFSKYFSGGALVGY